MDTRQTLSSNYFALHHNYHWWALLFFLGYRGIGCIYHIPFRVYRNGGYMALFVFFFFHY